MTEHKFLHFSQDSLITKIFLDQNSESCRPFGWLSTAYWQLVDGLVIDL